MSMSEEQARAGVKAMFDGCANGKDHLVEEEAKVFTNQVTKMMKGADAPDVTEERFQEGWTKMAVDGKLSFEASITKLKENGKIA